MKKKVLIEVCCGSVDDAIEAEKAGANRIELNTGLFFGGLTPSIGELIESKKVLNIPVAVMIRPRGGGFCYTDSEFKVMEHDVKAAIEYGADGIVFGILNEDGTLDEERCKRIVDLAGDKEAIFHRAFDVVPDPFETMDKLVEMGVKRILTKGQENTLEEGAGLIKKFIDYAGDRITIMPSGCKPYNVDWAMKQLDVSEIHIASYVTKEDRSVLSKPHVFFGSALRPPESTYSLVSYNFVKTIRDSID